MHYAPFRLAVEPSGPSLELARRARAGKLGLYLGAGVSKAEPTALPLGNELANSAIYTARHAFPEYFDADVEPATLEDLGSAIGPERRVEFNEMLLRLKPFTRADPNYGHSAVALLLLTELTTVLSANWDTCIERAGVAAAGGEIIPVVDDADRRGGQWRSRLNKVHGCACRAETLLVSHEELAVPPDWVSGGVSADLGADTLVFIGLGTVADYVGKRIRQLLEFGTEHVDDIVVVIPDETLPASWSDVLPDASRLVSMTADAFLDDLLRAIATLMIADVREELGRIARDLDNGNLEIWQNRVDLLVERLTSLDALGVLRWWTDGGEHRLVTDGVSSRQLLAVAALVDEDSAVTHNDRVACVALKDSYVELARVASGSGAEFRNRQEARVVTRASRGAYPQRAKPVCVLYDGEPSTPVPSRVRDVTDVDPDRLSVVEGAQGPEVVFRPVVDILHGMAA